MNYSFQPCGEWFVFDETTGATLAKDLKTQRAAIQWIIRERAAGNTAAN